jgi:hypothetical protein
MTENRIPSRVAKAAGIAAVLTSFASSIAHAHGDHGPGGHHDWSLDHVGLTHWGAVDLGIGAALVLGALFVLRSRRPGSILRKILRRYSSGR